MKLVEGYDEMMKDIQMTWENQLLKDQMKSLDAWANNANIKRAQGEIESSITKVYNTTPYLDKPQVEVRDGIEITHVEGPSRRIFPQCNEEYVPPISANPEIELRCQERRASGNFETHRYHTNSTCSSIFTYATEKWEAYDLPEVQAAEIANLKAINEELLKQVSESSSVGVNTSLIEECIILDAEIATLKEQCRDYYKARANMKAINEELLLQNTQLTEKLNFSTQLVEALTNLVTCQHAPAEKRDQPEPDTSLIK